MNVENKGLFEKVWHEICSRLHYDGETSRQCAHDLEIQISRYCIDTLDITSEEFNMFCIGWTLGQAAQR